MEHTFHKTRTFFQIFQISFNKKIRLPQESSNRIQFPKSGVNYLRNQLFIAAGIIALFLSEDRFARKLDLVAFLTDTLN